MRKYRNMWTHSERMYVVLHDDVEMRKRKRESRKEIKIFAALHRSYRCLVVAIVVCAGSIVFAFESGCFLRSTDQRTDMSLSSVCILFLTFIRNSSFPSFHEFSLSFHLQQTTVTREAFSCLIRVRIFLLRWLRIDRVRMGVENENTSVYSVSENRCFASHSFCHSKLSQHLLRWARLSHEMVRNNSIYTVVQQQQFVLLYKINSFQCDRVSSVFVDVAIQKKKKISN